MPIRPRACRLPWRIFCRRNFACCEGSCGLMGLQKFIVGIFQVHSLPRRWAARNLRVFFACGVACVACCVVGCVVGCVACVVVGSSGTHLWHPLFGGSSSSVSAAETAGVAGLRQKLRNCHNASLVTRRDSWGFAAETAGLHDAAHPEFADWLLLSLSLPSFLVESCPQCPDLVPVLVSPPLPVVSIQSCDVKLDSL